MAIHCELAFGQCITLLCNRVCFDCHLNSGLNSSEMSDKNTSQNCAKCSQKVVKDGLKAMNKLWHSSCFRCVVCQKCVDPKVVGKNFYEKDGKPYCETDFMNTFDKCCVCNKAITDRKLEALGRKYHSKCFVCSVCKKPLEGQTFNHDEQNSLYCVTDYQSKFAPKCRNCSKPIVPEGDQKEALQIKVFDNSYHIQCFKCEECKTVLDNDSNPCFPLGKQILCKKCFNKKNS